MEFRGDSWVSLYEQVRPHLISAPTSAPRGKLTKELLDVNLILEAPRRRLGFNEHRKYNLLFALTEALMLFIPTNELTYIGRYNKNMAQFSDDGETLHGAYGKRIATSIETVIDALIKDPMTRQAVLDFHTIGDLEAKTKDTPCTLSVQFLLRDNKLHAFTTMRSNDFWWGTPYDIVMFTVLQEVVANTLGVQLGAYHHHATSLHIYEHHFQLLEDIHTFMPVEFTIPYNMYDMQITAAYYMAMVNKGPIEVTYNTSEDFGPFGDLLFRAECYKQGQLVLKLHEDIEWAYDFVKRWYIKG